MSFPFDLSLHVGAHKTATTHLQKSLQKSHRLLARGRVAFYGPRFLRKPENGLDTLFSRREDSRTLSPDRLRALAGDAKRLILSEENALGVPLSPMFPSVLYPAGDTRLEPVLRGLDGLSVNLFLGIREPSGWLASLYRQRLWAGEWHDFHSFLSGHDPLAVRWSNLVERLRRLPNVAQVYVWRHEDYPLVTGPVLRRMVGWKLGPQVPRIDGRVNEGLSREVVAELVRRRMPPPGDPRDIVRAIRDDMAGAGGTPHDPWQADLRAASAQAYAQDVDRLAALPGVSLLQPGPNSTALGPNAP
jgi:hypothetical protein